MTTRRELLVALGALAMPLAGLAQQAKVSRLGVLAFSNLEPGLGYLREALRNLGYVEGKSNLIEVRSAEGKSDALAALAAELVRLQVDVLVALATPAAHAAKQATSTIPIVISAGDPVGTGLVASLARPGGNITGMSMTTAELSAKTLELIREIRPAGRSVAVLANATDPFTKPFLEQIHSAGRALGMEVRPAMVRRPEEFDAVYSEWSKAKVGAVIVQPSLPRGRAIELALKHRFVSGSPNLAFAVEGGLFGYAPSAKDQSRKTAIYVDRVLKGAKPADLPVEQPTIFELVVNLKTARALGVKIPQSILFRADRVIE
jgi:putative ABC transport system substrate-binding protein